MEGQEKSRRTLMQDSGGSEDSVPSPAEVQDVWGRRCTRNHSRVAGSPEGEEGVVTPFSKGDQVQ